LELQQLYLTHTMLWNDRKFEDAIPRTKQAPEPAVASRCIDAPASPPPPTKHPGVVEANRLVAPNVEIEAFSRDSLEEQPALAELTRIA
jgi:hypothetical protein